MQVSTTLFWGKARHDDDAISSMHPLVAHSLDVAAVAILLSQTRGIGLPGQTIGFLVALHDIGKFSRPFQAMAAPHWPAAALGAWLEDRRPPPGPKHDSLGFHLLEKVFTDRLAALLPPRLPGRAGWVQGQRVALLRALAGHHGRPPADPGRLGEAVFCAGCQAAAAGFIDAMRTLFAPAPLPAPASGHAADRMAWQLAGLTTLADWIGSRQAWFPYVGPEAVLDPAGYFWDRALPQAAAAIAAAGLANPRPARFEGLRGLFPGITTPSPAQGWAEAVELPEGPILAVIEDLTGSGKTEAALTLAHRLLATGRASGVFMALPTMATANAMFGRLAAAYRSLFAA
ncbi:MAG: CRISPR-associated endonuclease Cas3'', partial [Paracraurococcus sp.]